MAVTCLKCGTVFIDGLQNCSRCCATLPQPVQPPSIVEEWIPLFPISMMGSSVKDRSGIVYLIRCGPYYKIGKSTVPEKRHGQLKIQLPEKLELIHEIRTNDIDYTESHWHKRFAPQRMNGEWFSLTGADIGEFVRCRRMEIAQA